MPRGYLAAHHYASDQPHAPQNHTQQDRKFRVLYASLNHCQKIDKLQLCSIAPEVTRTSFSSKVPDGSYIPSPICSLVLISYHLHDNKVTASACANFQMSFLFQRKPKCLSYNWMAQDSYRIVSYSSNLKRGQEEEQECHGICKTVTKMKRMGSMTYSSLEKWTWRGNKV